MVVCLRFKQCGLPIAIAAVDGRIAHTAHTKHGRVAHTLTQTVRFTRTAVDWQQ